MIKTEYVLINNLNTDIVIIIQSYSRNPITESRKLRAKYILNHIYERNRYSNKNLNKLTNLSYDQKILISIWLDFSISQIERYQLLLSLWKIEYLSDDGQTALDFFSKNKNITNILTHKHPIFNV